MAQAFGHGILLACVVPCVSCNTPRTIALYQQVAAHIVVDLGTILQHPRCGQHYRHVAEDQNLHPERSFLERTQRALDNSVHARNECLKRLAAHWPGCWKERGIGQEVGRECVPIRRRARRPSQALEMGPDQGPDRSRVTALVNSRHITVSFRRRLSIRFRCPIEKAAHCREVLFTRCQLTTARRATLRKRRAPEAGRLNKPIGVEWRLSWRHL